MSTVTQSCVTVANKDQGTLAVQTQTEDGLELKTRHNDDGETSFIEGYAATTHKDEANDVFTEQALENMAERIRNSAEETVDVVFPHFEGMEESEIGNINHNNNPAAQELFGTDTRTVSVFRTVHAETHTLEDGETGLFIRGEMLPLPDDVEDAVKGQIEEGALHSFSIEFNPTNVNFGLQTGEPTRTILDAQPQGTALTGRPMNDEANLTNAELKNIMANHADNNNVKTNEDTSMSEESTETPDEQVEETESPEQEVTEEETPEEQETGEVKNEEGETEPEEDATEDTSEDEESEDVEEVETDGDGELKSDVRELKTMFKDIKEENESLREENRELKSKVEDLKTMDGLKTEINDIKSMIEDSGEDLEGDRPITNPDEEREVKNQTQKPRWQRVIDQLGYDENDLKTEIGKKGMTEAESIAETHGLKTQEVLDYVK